MNFMKVRSNLYFSLSVRKLNFFYFAYDKGTHMCDCISESSLLFEKQLKKKIAYKKMFKVFIFY